MSVEDIIGDVIKRTLNVQVMERMMNATDIIQVGTVTLPIFFILRSINSIHQNLIPGPSPES